MRFLSSCAVFAGKKMLLSFCGLCAKFAHHIISFYFPLLFLLFLLLWSSVFSRSPSLCFWSEMMFFLRDTYHSSNIHTIFIYFIYMVCTHFIPWWKNGGEKADWKNSHLLLIVVAFFAFYRIHTIYALFLCVFNFLSFRNFVVRCC